MMLLKMIFQVFGSRSQLVTIIGSYILVIIFFRDSIKIFYFTFLLFYAIIQKQESMP